ncbi:MAG: hypothetical protein CSA50_03145 [Gammaproteobacteria bacterium]|nr:MAG: hypothetical protein CSA50_03145 [Gammaproteobacteria bacterium]
MEHALDKKILFDNHAEAYDAWFFNNTNLLTSEVKLAIGASPAMPHASQEVGERVSFASAIVGPKGPDWLRNV